MSSKQTSPSLPNPYPCTKCTRSFPVRASLKSHCQATGHIYPCSVRGCKKQFLSDTALAAHRASKAHVLTPTRAINNNGPSKGVVRVAAQSAQHSTQASPGVRSLRCNLSGCNKMFKTSAARLEHQQSNYHSEKSMVIKGQKGVRTKAVLGVQDKTVCPVINVQPVGRAIVDRSLVETLKSSNSAAVPIQTHLEKPVAPSKAVQTPLSSSTESAKRTTLFRWDSRWSAIPSTADNAIMASLRACLPGPETPTIRIDKSFWTPDQKSTPDRSTSPRRRQAIALDCEMIGIGHKGTTSEVARLSAIDFLTGELLIDSLIQPLCKVTDWRTKYSGIDKKTMELAVSSGTALKGSSAARAELFNFMDSQTILVGHALHYDLAALGIRHELTVDSSVLAKTAVGKRIKRDWGLKTLCKELLGITVQDNGANGHDAVEDALAAREVVLWCMQHEKELKAWGSKKKKEYYSKPKKDTKKPTPQRLARTPLIWCDDDSDRDEFGHMSLAEFNELCGYPEWYDNWSD